MKHLFPIFLFLSIARLGFSQGYYDSQFNQLNSRHTQAIQSAITPINKKYLSDLKSLLSKATQAGDFDTAVKVKEAIKLQTGFALLDFPGTWKLSTKSGYSTIVTLREGGTLTRDDGLRGTWKVSNNQLLFQYFPSKSINYFALPANDKIAGQGYKDGAFDLTLTRVEE